MSTHRRRNATRASILAGAVALALSVAAQAQDVTFDIGAGDLKAALEAYAKQTGQQLVYQPDDVKGRSSPGVHGSMTSEQALTALLAGTGLKVNKDPSGAIAIFPAEAVAGGASTETAGNDQRLEEVIVTATAVSQIYVTSRSATRLDTDPMDLPMSISAVQGDLMKMQQSRTLTDVLNNVAGVDVNGGNGVWMRGFQGSIARNGTIQSGVLSQQYGNRPTVAVDRVEVVKGPEQILQGSGGSIGGTVNLITKLPQAQPSAYLGSAIGSDGYWRLDADVNDTLLGDEGNRLMGRLVGSTSDAGKTDVGYDGESNDFVSAGLRWTNDDWGSDLAVVYEYNESSIPQAAMVVTMGDSLHSGMKEYAFGARNTYSKRNDDLIDVNFTQRLWQTWKLGVNYIWRDANFRGKNTFPWEALDPDTVLASTGWTEGTNQTSQSDDLKLDIRGEINTGPVAHKLMLAYDYSTNYSKTGLNPFNTQFYYTDLNTREQTLGDAFSFQPRYDFDISETGVLLVDQVNWNAWSGLFGVRWVGADRTFIVKANGSQSTQSSDATLPQYGLVYQVTPDVRLYASGGEGFQSNDGYLDRSGQQLPNETSTQYEAGVKALLLNQQVAVTLALYRIHQKNVAEYLDTLPSGINVFELIPGLTSKGVEFEVSGQPIRGLQMRANYTYTQQEDQDGVPPFGGYVPSSFNLWAQYWLTREPGQGWWGALGLEAKNSSVATDMVNVPGYTIFDLQAGYSTEHWSAIAGFKNVADIQTFYPTGQDYQFGLVQPGASFTFDLSYQF